MSYLAKIDQCMRWLATVHFFVLAMGVSSVAAEEPTKDLVRENGISEKRIREAVVKALPLVEKAAAVSIQKRNCFTCHNAGTAMFAIEAARVRGFSVDRKNLEANLKLAYADAKRAIVRDKAGRATLGEADAAGWKLMSMAELGQPVDDSILETVEYILNFQKDSDHWAWSGPRRPPTVASPFTSTWVALAGLDKYSSPQHENRIKQRRDDALQWLLNNQSRDTEDSTSRLRALHLAGAHEEAVSAEARKLIGQQRADGGWAQLSRYRKSDAYATSTALLALLETEQLLPDDPVAQRGFAWLLDTQLPDGSWQVTKRAWRIQPHYESSFPHGRDQFISATATAWAICAMLTAIPTTESEPFVSTSHGGKSINESVTSFGDKSLAVYREKIQPVLKENCYQCHSSTRETEGDLALDSIELMLVGGENGPAIVPGHAKRSLILKALHGEGLNVMPPEGEPLHANTIRLIQRWIDNLKPGGPDAASIPALEPLNSNIRRPPLLILVAAVISIVFVCRRKSLSRKPHEIH